MLRNRSACASLALRTRYSGFTSHTSTPSDARITSISGARGSGDETMTMRSICGSFRLLPRLAPSASWFGARLLSGEEGRDGLDAVNPGQPPAFDLPQLVLRRGNDELVWVAFPHVQTQG